MGADKSAENTQNAQKIFGPICLAKTKVWAFRKKLSLGVRSPCSSASLVITIYDIRIRPYDLWACTFSLHVQKREGRAVGYLLLAPHRRQRHRRDASHRAVPAVCSWRI